MKQNPNNKEVEVVNDYVGMLCQSDELCIDIARAFGSIDKILMESQRNMVSHENVASAGPTVLAANVMHKTFMRANLKGIALLKAANQSDQKS